MRLAIMCIWAFLSPIKLSSWHQLTTLPHKCITTLNWYVASGYIKLVVYCSVSNVGTYLKLSSSASGSDSLRLKAALHHSPRSCAGSSAGQSVGGACKEWKMRGKWVIQVTSLFWLIKIYKAYDWGHLQRLGGVNTIPHTYIISLVVTNCALPNALWRSYSGESRIQVGIEPISFGYQLTAKLQRYQGSSSRVVIIQCSGQFN